MDQKLASLFADLDRRAISRRTLLQTLGVVAIGAPIGAALGQGRCRDTHNETPACDTTAITPLFKPTGWKTISLDHITMQVADYRKEAAFLIALMGWTLREDDGTKATLAIGDVGSMIIRGGAAAGGRAVVDSFSFGITPWNAKDVEKALRDRGMNPVADNDGKGFESFHVIDPDGFDLQISNGAFAKPRSTAPTLAEPAPFAPTGWKTVWLDHISFSVVNYKVSASFYTNLLGWKSTYDEGSQNELMIGEIGDIIIRGGNPLDPNFGRGGRGGGGRGATDTTGGGRAGGGAPVRRARIDHISFGISPWDTDGVKAELEKRGLRARVDTSTRDEIHVAAFKSYHTTTPNGYDLQISAVSHDTRLTLPNAVRPKPPAHP